MFADVQPNHVFVGIALILGVVIIGYSGKLAEIVDSIAGWASGVAVVVAAAVIVVFSIIGIEDLHGYDVRQIIIGAIIPLLLEMYVFIGKKLRQFQHSYGAEISRLADDFNNKVASIDSRLSHLNDVAAIVLAMPDDAREKVVDAIKGLNQISRKVDGMNLINPVAHSFSHAVNGVVENRELYLTKDVFNSFWKVTIDGVRRYISVSDLTPYCSSGVSDTAISILTKQVKDDIHKLTMRGHSGDQFKFDKIILYNTPNNGDEHRSKCGVKDGGHCTPSTCDTTNSCVVKKVAALWLDHIAANKGLFSSNIDMENKTNIWMMSASGFASNIIDAMKLDPCKIEIQCTDIGLFGDNLVGEEHKTVRPGGNVLYTYVFYQKPNATDIALSYLHQQKADGKLYPCS